MKLKIAFLSLLTAGTFFYGCKTKAPADTRLGKATREDKNGWIYIHLAGSPADIGYQHGYLVAKEIDTMIKVLQYYLPPSSGKDWAFYRGAAQRFLWKKIDKEYQDEIKGIVDGLQAKGFKYDTLDIAAMNAYYELPGYYVPMLMERQNRAAAITGRRAIAALLLPPAAIPKTIK